MNRLEKLKENALTELSLPTRDGSELKILVQEPSLVRMAKNGEIPNKLLGTVNEMILGKETENSEIESDDLVQNFSELVDIYCKATMVDPSYEEGFQYLNDEQLNTILDFALRGIAEVEPFRKKSKNDNNNNDVAKLQNKAIGDIIYRK